MKIRISRRPDGEAPEELRDQWVGVEMNCEVAMVQAAALAMAFGSTPRGVISGDRIDLADANASGYPIEISECMSALKEAGRGDAVSQWEEILVGKTGHLVFGMQFCEVVEISAEELAQLGLKKCADCDAIHGISECCPG